MTGKSALLQKIRETNRTGDKYSNKCIGTPYSVPGNKGEELKEKLHQPESTCRLEPQHLRDNKQSLHVQLEYRNPKTESSPITQQSTIETPKQQRYVFFPLFAQHIIEQRTYILTTTTLLLVTNRDNILSRIPNTTSASKFLSNWKYIVLPNLSIRSSQQQKEPRFFMIW